MQKGGKEKKNDESKGKKEMMRIKKKIIQLKGESVFTLTLLALSLEFVSFLKGQVVSSLGLSLLLSAVSVILTLLLCSEVRTIFAELKAAILT